MEEPGDGAVGCATDDEHGILIVEAKQRVERHDEAAFRLAAAPRTGQLFELMSERRVDLARAQRARRVAGAFEPVDRLAHLPDRSSLQREGFGVDDGLVAVVERVQSVRAVDVERGFGCAEDRNPPVARPRELQERSD